MTGRTCLRSLLLSLGFICLSAGLLPQSAGAVVRPPDEWFDSPEKDALWQSMWPTLNEWEFGKPERPLTPPRDEALTVIQLHLGLTLGQAAAEMGTPQDTTEALRYDLNLDGSIDHFDVLELGYEVVPSVKRASTAPPKGTNELVVLRADFQGENANYTNYNIPYFNDRFFSLGTAAKPSFRDYFKEVSYSQLDTIGAVPDCGPGGDGWCKGDNNKNWYISNGGNNLVKEAILDADAEGFDFSQYDVDGDGYVDTVMCYYPNVVFSGGLWPHRSSGLNIHVDGVIIDSYFISGYNTGNDSWTMVIAAHEYGHILGLPDLYDVNGGSAGMGFWSLMAYNYDNDQKPPSLDPWCKTQLGWVQPEVIYENQDNFNLPNYQDSPKVLKVWTNGKEEDQYFLVANYRKKKTDANRPGQGLLVLHIDDSIGGNDQDNANEDRKHVDVESATGFWAATKDTNTPKDQLDDGNNGTANDLWFQGNSDGDYTGIFDDTSNPHAKKYKLSGAGFDPTFTKLSDISASADTMTLDITVRTADAPVVTITSPLDAATVTGNQTVDVDVVAGSGRTILRADFFCNGAYLGTDSTLSGTSPHFSLSFDSLPIYNGSRKLKVIAYDNAGDAVDTTEEIGVDEITVTIDNTGIALPTLDDFESGIGAFAVYDFGGNQRWKSKSIGYASSQSAGLNNNDSANGPLGYDYNEHDELVSPRLDLSTVAHPVLRFRQRYRVAGGENTIKVFITTDDGATFDLLSGKTGSSSGQWLADAVDLVDYIGETAAYLVFRLDSTSLNNSQSSTSGWWIDNFEVGQISGPPSVLTITPGDGSNLTGQQTITVTATDDLGVTSVEFWLNSSDLLHTDLSDPFTYNWNSDWVFDGSHTFKAKAFDADEQSAEASVGWTTSNPGLAIPWGEDFTTDPGIAWRIRDLNGGGDWHRVGTGGYSSSAGMQLSQGSTYDDNEYDWFISPTFFNNGVTKPGIGYQHKYDIEATYDFGRLYVTTNLNTWTQLNVFSATGQPWQAAGARLDAYNGQKVKLAWFFEADGGVVEEGWTIDGLLIDPAPVITSVTPRVAVGGTITITGTGFGSGPASDFPRVTVKGSNATVLTWSDTQITATAPNVSSGNVIVIRHGIPSDGFPIKIVFNPPTLGGLGQL